MKPEPEKEELLGFLDCAVRAAQAAGRFLVSKMGQVSVQEKNPGDFVTQADIESQSIIQRAIQAQFPEHDFLGEEEPEAETAIQGAGSDRTIASDSGPKRDGPSEFCWIVDPLDGTTNFIHQLRSFSVSIGLRYRDSIIVGCVHDPLLDETYTAAKGLGAHLNGEPVQTSQSTSTRKSIVVCSLPRDIDRDSVELKQLINVLCDSEATVRRLGSAALNMCYIACGRLDAYWSTFAKIWDIAAGLIILQEAGGVIRKIDGNEIDWNELKFVASATESLNREMIQLLDVEKLDAGP